MLAGQPWAGRGRGGHGLERDVEIDDLLGRVPAALDDARDGLQRVATIVRSMTMFAHPHRAMAPANLTDAIRATLTVAASEYRMVADLVLDLCELPLVTCHLGDINQVILNLVINAAQAIADAVRGSSQRGRLVVCTRRIGDEGPDLDLRYRRRNSRRRARPGVRPVLHDQEVGRGSGQGLAIARTVVCDMHGGQITFETELGRGTTFHVRLPIAPRPR